MEGDEVTLQGSLGVKALLESGLPLEVLQHPWTEFAAGGETNDLKWLLFRP